MDLQPGQPLWWLDSSYVSGYSRTPVKAIFIKRGRTKRVNIGIAVQLTNGTWVPKWTTREYIEIRIEED